MGEGSPGMWEVQDVCGVKQVQGTFEVPGGLDVRVCACRHI